MRLLVQLGQLAQSQPQPKQQASGDTLEQTDAQSSAKESETLPSALFEVQPMSALDTSLLVLATAMVLLAVAVLSRK